MWSFDSFPANVFVFKMAKLNEARNVCHGNEVILLNETTKLGILPALQTKFFSQNLLSNSIRYYSRRKPYNKLRVIFNSPLDLIHNKLAQLNKPAGIQIYKHHTHAIINNKMKRVLGSDGWRVPRFISNNVWILLGNLLALKRAGLFLD